MLTTTQTTTSFIAPSGKFTVATDRQIVAYARSNRGPEVIERQHRELGEYCRQVFGCPLDAFYRDGRTQGFALARPGMRALIQDARAGRIAVVLVDDLDRISRSFDALAAFGNLCDSLNIRIHLCSAGCDAHSSLWMPPTEQLERLALAAARRLASREHATMDGAATKSVTG